MKYKLVIFDMDGTILNTIDDLAVSLNYTLKMHGYPEHSTEDVRKFVGNGIRKLIERAVPENTPSAQIDTLFEIFNSHYKIHCADNTKPYDGIIKILKNLRSKEIKTAVVSNKADYAVKDLCQKYFEGLFDCAVGERSGLKKKPSADPVNKVISDLGIDRSDSVYVGDSDVDIETAINSDMDCIVVEWGFRDRDFLIEHGAKVLVSSADELEKLCIQD